jgi:hypothetical protein
VALQYFIEVAWHLETPILQVRHAPHASVTGRHTPELVYRSQFALLERKTSSIGNQQPFEG